MKPCEVPAREIASCPKFSSNLNQSVETSKLIKNQKKKNHMNKKETLYWFGLGLVVLVEGWLKHWVQGKERILKKHKTSA